MTYLIIIIPFETKPILHPKTKWHLGICIDTAYSKYYKMNEDEKIYNRRKPKLIISNIQKWCTNNYGKNFQKPGKQILCTEKRPRKNKKGYKKKTIFTA